MAVPKKGRPTANDSEAQGKVIFQITDLLKKNWSSFKAVLKQSETQKANWTFAVGFDYSEAVAIIETRSTFSEVHKDKRTSELDNPNQAKLPGVADEETAGTKRVDFKKAAAGDKDED